MSYSLLPLDELRPFSVKQAANDLSFELGVHNNKSLGYDFAPELEALKQKNLMTFTEH